MSELRCSAVLNHRRMYVCGNPVKVERDGKPWCSIHDPVRGAERQAQAARERHRDHCEAVHAEMLEALRTCLAGIEDLTVCRLPVPDALKRAADAARAAIAKAEGGGK